MTSLMPQPPGAALVPAGFAEKAMASLMQLHGELMDEKERRVDLYRRLMEKEQLVSELRMYIRSLEEKLGEAPSDTARAVPAHPVSAATPGHFTTSRAPRSHPQSAEAPAVSGPLSASGAPQRVAPGRPLGVPPQPATAVKPAPLRATALPPQPPQISRAAIEGWKAW